MTTTELVETKKLGRPLKIGSSEELKSNLDAFFIDCEQKGDVPTVLGMSIWLNCDRRSLLNYSKKESLFPIIKKAMDICTHSIEQRGIKGIGSAPFLMFWLTNNTGDWINQKYERKDIHHSGKVEVVLLPQGGYITPKEQKKQLKEGGKE